MPTTLSSQWGDTYWSFTPEYLLPDTTYTLTVPADLLGANGKAIGSAYVHTFRTERANALPLSWEPATLSSEAPLKITPTQTDKDEIHLSFYVENDARNAVEFYSSPECTEDTLLRTVSLMGYGTYEVTLPKVATVYLKQKREKGEYPTTITGVYGLAPKGTGYGAVEMREGTPSFRIAVGPTKFNLGHATYGTFECLTYKNLIGRPLVAEDYGRTFRLTFRVYDTTSRQIVTVFHSMSDPETQIRDYRVARRNYTTKAGESVECTFDFTLYHPSHGEVGIGDKYLSFHINPTGNTELPLYFSDFTLTETVTDTRVTSFVQIL